MAKVAVRLVAFAPTDIPNMVLHLDAKTGVYVDAGATLATDGQTVRQWNDASGQANHAGQATAELRPTYRASGFNGLPGIQCASSRLATPSFLGAQFDTAMTVFYICAGSSGTPLSADEWGFAIEERYPYRSSFYSDGIVEAAAQSVGVQIDAGNYRCCGMSYDGAIWRTMMNGHLVKWSETGNLGLTGALSVGAMSVTPNHFTGTIGEIYAWRYGVTDAQMRSMSDYLFARWGITAPTPRRTICYTGDSITFDFGTPESHYPGMIELAVGPVGQSHNAWAVSGASLSYLSDLAAVHVDRFVDAGQTLRINTIFAGTNDLAGEFTTAQNVYDLTTAWVTARKAAGWHKVVVFTILPRTAPGDDPNFETKRQAFNAMLRANWATFADGLADVAANTTIGEAGDELNLTYYQDGIHPTAAGHVIIAGILQPVIEGLL